jgi:hypothetical protein
MKTKKSLCIAKRHLARVALSFGLCLLSGCASQETRKSQNDTAEVETEKAGKTITTSDQVPDAVKRAFQVKFPSAKPAEWKIKSGQIYEAEFTLKGTEITAMFDAAGKWLETESAISPAKVPKAVSDAAGKQFKGYKVIETQSVERPNEQHLIYELHFENAKEIVKAQFSSEGAILNQKENQAEEKQDKSQKTPEAKALPRFTHPREITNPYLPLASLKQDILEGKEGSKKVRIERTAKPDVHKTFKLGGQTVEALAVEDREFENDQLAEVAVDYFAQADDGTVYYLGETVDEYKNGKVVGHGGAWMYGVNTKIPGVLMPAHPKIGDKFQSENVPKITREDDEVVSLSETVTVPAGTYQNCLKIKEVLSDGGIEYKYYAPEIGCVKEASADGEVPLRSHATQGPVN